MRSRAKTSWSSDALTVSSTSVPIVFSPRGRESVAAFSALARNDQFLSTLGKLGWIVHPFRGFRDHHRFSREEVAGLRAGAGGKPLLTTMKDLVRLPEGEEYGILALEVEVLPLGGTDALFRKVSGKVEEWRTSHR